MTPLEGANWSLIPEHMHDAVRGYILEGWRPGDFLRAVLSNNLKEAVGRADEENQRALVGWVRFLYNYAPGPCWGTPERVDEWMAQGGYEGLVAADVAEAQAS